LTLFWSDIGIQLLNKKLKSTLFYLGEIIEDGFEQFIINKQLRHAVRYNPPMEQRECMIAASYVFGRYRLQMDNKNNPVFTKAIEILIEKQASDGSWWEGVSSGGNIILTAAILQSLVLTMPFGAERHIKKAKNYLIKMQNSDGGWPEARHKDAVYTTVFVLDALELANGGVQVTYSLPTNEKEDISLDLNKGNITINAPGKVLVNQASGDINIAEDIKSKVEVSENSLLKDNPINQAIYIEFQKYEAKKESNPKAKRPSYRHLSKVLSKNKITSHELSAESIRKKVDKLVKAELIQDYYSELKRKSRETSVDPDILDAKKQDDYFK